MRHTVWGDSGVVHVGAVVSVVNDEYTVRPAKTPEAFGHEINYAFWGWDDAIILKDLQRVTTMTTKDACEEIAKPATAATKVSYLKRLGTKSTTLSGNTGTMQLSSKTFRV